MCYYVTDESHTSLAGHSGECVRGRTRRQRMLSSIRCSRDRYRRRYRYRRRCWHMKYKRSYYVMGGSMILFLPAATLSLHGHCPEHGCSVQTYHRLPLAIDGAEPEHAEVWRPEQDSPIDSSGRRRCQHTSMRIPGIKPFAMCVMGIDQLISRFLRRKGRWFECNDIVHSWEAMAGPASSKGLFVDLGSNIGACSFELALRTNATIVAIEPNPANLFYLSSTPSVVDQPSPTTRPRAPPS